MSEIAVSVICNAYNHEKYIRDALDGFVMQKTNFPFEVLIHDDASTDKTADIIREYEKKYPDIIKPIYQTENQYSKGNGAVGKIQRARVRGKYIALCEGDDYWTDPLKLQKQYDAMEAHPEIDICCHSAYKVKANTKEIMSIIQADKDNSIISAEKVIFGGGGFVATNSIMYRASINQNIPKFRQNCNFDYMLQIHGSLRGGMLYLNDIMAAYRVAVDNSWTQKMRRNENLRTRHHELIICALDCLNSETGKKYDAVIKEHINAIKFENAINNEDYKNVKRNFKKYYDRLSFKHRLYITAAQYIPSIKHLRGKFIKWNKA